MLANEQGVTRIGLRTRRGLKSAVTRNRFKRQIRTIVYGKTLSFRTGRDVVIVIHPQSPFEQTASLETELVSLCKRIGALQ